MPRPRKNGPKGAPAAAEARTYTHPEAESLLRPDGSTSAPFEPDEHARVAVRVIDDHGNEPQVVKKLGEAAP